MRKSIPFSPAIGGCQSVLNSMGSYGCYFLSILYLLFKLELPVDILVSIWTQAVRSKILGADGYVYDPLKLMDLARTIVGNEAMVIPKQVVKVDSKETLSPKFDDLPMMIACWQRAGEICCHFTVVKSLGDGSFDMIYDPWGSVDGSPSGSTSAIVNGGKIVSLRVFF